MALEVTHSVNVAVPATEAWAAVGAFGAIGQWHPAIATCETYVEDGTTHRRLTTVDGGELLEKLLTHDDDAMAYSYSIESSPLPVVGYVAEFRVSSEGAGAGVTWSSRFLPDGVSDDDARAVVAGIYEAGLANVRTMLG